MGICASDTVDERVKYISPSPFYIVIYSFNGDNDDDDYPSSQKCVFCGTSREGPSGYAWNHTCCTKNTRQYMEWPIHRLPGFYKYVSYLGHSLSPNTNSLMWRCVMCNISGNNAAILTECHGKHVDGANYVYPTATINLLNSSSWRHKPQPAVNPPQSSTQHTGPPSRPRVVSVTTKGVTTYPQLSLYDDGKSVLSKNTLKQGIYPKFYGSVEGKQYCCCLICGNVIVTDKTPHHCYDMNFNIGLRWNINVYDGYHHYVKQKRHDLIGIPRGYKCSKCKLSGDHPLILSVCRGEPLSESEYFLIQFASDVHMEQEILPPPYEDIDVV